MLCAIIGVFAWHEMTINTIADQVTNDRASHPSAAFIQQNIPIARNVQIGDMHRVDLVIEDSRAMMASWTYIVPAYFGYDNRLLFTGARTPEMRQAARENPLVLVRMHANCRTLKWRIAGLGAARSYDEAPVRVEYAKRPPRILWLDMGERNRHAICDAPDSTSPSYRETPSKNEIAVQSIPAHDPRTRWDGGDTLWYGIDLLHPVPVDVHASSTPWHDVRTPAGWTSATQSVGWNPAFDDTSGPALHLSLDTRTPQAAVAAARLIADQLVRRFDLGPQSRLLTTGSGYLIMRIAFSPTPRADRPLSSTLRLVELRQTDEGIDLWITVRGRYARDVQAWLSSRQT